MWWWQATYRSALRLGWARRSGSWRSPRIRFLPAHRRRRRSRVSSAADQKRPWGLRPTIRSRRAPPRPQVPGLARSRAPCPVRYPGRGALTRCRRLRRSPSRIPTRATRDRTRAPTPAPCRARYRHRTRSPDDGRSSGAYGYGTAAGAGRSCRTARALGVRSRALRARMSVRRVGFRLSKVVRNGTRPWRPGQRPPTPDLPPAVRRPPRLPHCSRRAQVAVEEGECGWLGWGRTPRPTTPDRCPGRPAAACRSARRPSAGGVRRRGSW